MRKEPAYHLSITKTTAFIAAACSAALLLAVGPANAGPPFRTDDPEPVEKGHGEFYLLSYATRANGGTSGVLPAIEMNYGPVEDVHLHVLLPIAFDSPSGGKTQRGYGDTELGVKYRFVHEDEEGWRPMIGTFPIVVLPTGNDNKGLGGGHTMTFLPIWLQKSFGSWTTYGGGGYWTNPGTGNKNFWFTGWLLQRKINDSLTLGGEVFHETADTVGGRGNSGYNLGGVYNFTEHDHFLFSAGKGFQNVADTNKFSYYLAYQLTF
jgi:hypothetical protein